MRRLDRAVRRSEAGGEPLPSVFKALEAMKIVLRRSEISMIAGQPGAGKSTLALALALRMRVPTLYFSADTGAHTMGMRCLSMLSNKTQEQAELSLAKEPAWSNQVLQDTRHIMWSFDSSPTLEDMDTEVKAFEELWGTNPSLIVVDNLIDISDGGGEEFSQMRQTMKELKYLARITNAAVLVLHHTSEAYDGHPCPPRSAIQGKVSQLPALICSVAQTATGDLAVAPLKNRYGKADPSGTTATFLVFNGENMLLADRIS